MQVPARDAQLAVHGLHLRRKPEIVIKEMRAPCAVAAPDAFADRIVAILGPDRRVVDARDPGKPALRAVLRHETTGAQGQPGRIAHDVGREGTGPVAHRARGA